MGQGMSCKGKRVCAAGKIFMRLPRNRSKLKFEESMAQN
jgi:hypothetical protein